MSVLLFALAVISALVALVFLIGTVAVSPTVLAVLLLVIGILAAAVTFPAARGTRL